VGLALRLDRRHALSLARPGLAAASAWLVFATLYYGFPFPNTAYAKLNTAIPLGQLVAQGLSYLMDSLTREPLVLSVIAGSLAVAARRRTPSPERVLALGVLLYVAYVVSIGGDFMTGRFLTTCYLVSLLLLAERASTLGPWTLPVAAAALVPFLEIGIALRPAADTAGLASPDSGIVDERAFYVPDTGVAVNIRGRKWRNHPYTETFKKMTPGPERVILPGTIGLATYANTAEKHVVEGYALGDPFLARIRFSPTPGWRIGHFQRDLPVGYIESMRSGKNVLKDPCLRTLYDRLQTVTQGPIWSLPRFRDIVLLNTTAARCPRPAG
jgi:arabinofuranosyltransferase